ncbi:MAG: hypothetical protein AAF975_09275, partial [Spirochaetota bacterium]
HFGAIMPQLSFLHTGLKISDLIGFNVPFSNKGEKVRYALDFDWGVYAEHQFPKYLRVFGGLELIQIRGLFPKGQSPYSALFEPIDHLRLLAGIGLFNNTLQFVMQYYNSNFSPSLMFNLGPFQLNAALNLSTSSATKAWGAEFTIRFRGPHDGFNKRTPYKTYSQWAAEKADQSKAQDKAQDKAQGKDAESVKETSEETVLEAEQTAEASDQKNSETTAASTEASAEEATEIPASDAPSEENAGEGNAAPEAPVESPDTAAQGTETPAAE